MKSFTPLTIEIYTDGSSTGKVGEGGWGFVILINGSFHYEDSGGALETTNNRMELQAAIEGLEAVYNSFSSESNVTVYSDSQYVTKGITEWYPNWEKKMAKGKQIKNQDLWINFKQLTDQFSSIKFEWVKGHSGIDYNERCDYLAKQAKQEIKNQSSGTVIR